MKRYVCCSVILMGLLLASDALVEGAEWVYVTSSGDRDVYYDKSSLAYQANGVVTFWWKGIVTNPQYAEREKKRRIAEGIKSDGYEDWDHDIVQWEINCNLKQSRVRQFTDYGKDGGVLDSLSYVGDWGTIVPDSLLDSLIPFVCKKKVKK